MTFFPSWDWKGRRSSKGPFTIDEQFRTTRTKEQCTIATGYHGRYQESVAELQVTQDPETGDARPGPSMLAWARKVFQADY